jgi:hypothetical protein
MLEVLDILKLFCNQAEMQIEHWKLVTKRMKFILGEIPFSGFQPDLLATLYWMPTRSAYN